MHRCTGVASAQKGVFTCSVWFIEAEHTSQENLDGKTYFVGCSRWNQGSAARAHRFISIPKEIDEELLRELFQNNGQFKNPDAISNSEVLAQGSGKCAYILPPRNGGKGRRLCRKYLLALQYSHISNYCVFE